MQAIQYAVACEGCNLWMLYCIGEMERMNSLTCLVYKYLKDLLGKGPQRSLAARLSNRFEHIEHVVIDEGKYVLVQETGEEHASVVY